MDVNMKNICIVYFPTDSIEKFLRKNILKKVGVHSFIISSANKMAERSCQT